MREERKKLEIKQLEMEANRLKMEADAEIFQEKLAKAQQALLDKMNSQLANTDLNSANFNSIISSSDFNPAVYDFTPAVYDGRMPSYLMDNNDELLARRDSSSMSYSSASSDLSESLRDGVTVSNNLLRRLITTLQDKDLSVTVVDTEGNEKDQSTYLIKRQNQLEYRNATELA
jgi:hypothetical protein